MRNSTSTLNDPVSKKRYFSLTLMTMVITLTVFVVVMACSRGTATAKPNYVFKDAPRAGVVAKINGEEITEEMLINDAKDKIAFVDAQKKLYELKMSLVQKLLREKIIGAKAKEAGMDLQAFIDKKIVTGGTKVSEKDFQEFIKSRKIPENRINPEIKGRIETFLIEQKKDEQIQAYIAKATKSDPVEVYFKRPKNKVEMNVGESPTWGDQSAKVTIVEFSDFQCPYCSRANDTVTEIKKKYKGKVKIAFKHFPLSIHSEARAASEASMCVSEQDKDKFWKYHDMLFQNQQALKPEQLEEYAKKVGANVGKFKECMEAKKFAKHVQDDLDYGDKMGVSSTPTFFINGELVSGAVPFEEFAEAIDEALGET